MACGCNSKTCLELLLDTCAPNVELPIVATATGTHVITVEFNGVAQRREFEAIQGDSLIVPNLFNGDYTHLVKIYAAGSNTPTCYTIRTMASVWHDPLPYPVPPTAGNNVVSYIFRVGDSPDLQDGRLFDEVYENGSIFQSDLLIDKEVTDLKVGSADILPENGGYSFESTTGTLTFANEITDLNIYIQAEVAVSVATEYLLTESGDLLITEDEEFLSY